MAKSAKRRHHIERLKKNRKHYWGRDSRYMPPMTPKQLGMVVKYPKACGCFMCSRNKKKVFGKTTYEMRQEALRRFEMEENNYDYQNEVSGA